jgi:phosphoenolpyruvate synthase/pyruvate phosphate dikinase
VSAAEIPIADGATVVADRGVFETLSHRDDVPGALGVREVKYLVAGVDTKVNLRAKQNNTPNAYLRAAATDPRIAKHVDSIVRYEVAPDDIDIRAASADEMEEFLEKQRPDKPQTPPRDLSRTEIVDLDKASHADLTSIGAKAANLAELRRVLAPDIVPHGYGVPFYFYDRFMTKNDLYEEIRDIIEDDEFLKNEEIREERLSAIRKKIRRAKMPGKLRDALGEMRERFPAGIRCRSSTNNEDLKDFNGAGLYDSFTHRPDEGHIEETVKQVWASLWNRRAFEERHFYRIDHFHTAMAVLVHPNFDDEIANGVALTKNVYFPDFRGFYVNVQVGESLVTNPDPNAIPDELLVMEDVDQSTPETPAYETIRIRRSSLVGPGKSVLTDAQLKLLTRQMELIQEHFKRVYEAETDQAFAMDLEFKIDSREQLTIKQARPWVD